MPLPKRRRKREKRFTLPQSLRDRIQQEANSLGLTQNEYMRLLLSLSSTFRASLLHGRTVDAAQVLQLVESPLFGVVLQWVVNMAQEMASAKPEEGKPEEANTVQPITPQVRQPSPVPMQQTQPPMPPEYQWY